MRDEPSNRVVVAYICLAITSLHDAYVPQLVWFAMAVVWIILDLTRPTDTGTDPR